MCNDRKPKWVQWLWQLANGQQVLKHMSEVQGAIGGLGKVMMPTRRAGFPHLLITGQFHVNVAN